MANHCINQLTLTSMSEDKVIEALEFIKKDKDNLEGETDGIGTIDFNKILPEPLHTSKAAWDRWCNKHWGTSRNAYDCVYDSDSQCITFNTAWTPPYRVIETLARRFPEVLFTLKYVESRMGFTGIYEFENGRMTLDNIYSVDEYCDDYGRELSKDLLGFDMFIQKGNAA
ncbi:MAG: hypothetical protein QMC67_13195 [Candidatus Wallbacteria bacterium]